MLFAQKGFNYKAIITDDNGVVIQNQNVNIQFSILENGTTVVYKETHTLTTNDNGIIITNIGEGTPVTNTFLSINWRNEQFLKVEINTGSGYSDFGTTALKYTPYAKTAEKLLPTDNITIGNSIMQDEKLFIETEYVTNGEVVDFRLTNPSQYNDILNLHMDNIPASGRAQFIEASRGSSVKFKVDDDGRVYTQKGYYTDGYVSAIGDIESYGIIHAYGNLAVDGEVSNLNMGTNEIHGTESGNADMKAYFYGYVSDSGIIDTSVSSSGFTVTRQSEGKYYISNSAGTSFPPIVIIASIGYEIGFIRVHTYLSGSTHYYYIKTYNASGILTDSSFSLVAFKK